MHQRFSFASESASAQRSRLMGRSSFAAPALKKKKRKLLVVQVEDPPTVAVQQQPVFAAHIREESASLSPQVLFIFRFVCFVLVFTLLPCFHLLVSYCSLLSNKQN